MSCPAAVDVSFCAFTIQAVSGIDLVFRVISTEQSQQEKLALIRHPFKRAQMNSFVLPLLVRSKIEGH